MFKGLRDKIGQAADAQKTAKKIEELCQHIEDIACAQDDMTKALCTIYRDMRQIAQGINIKLEKPLINMKLEKGKISADERKTIIIEGDSDADASQ